MAAIWKLLCSFLVLLAINEGHGEPRYPYSAQGRGMQRQGSFGRRPMNPLRTSSMEEEMGGPNSGKTEDSEETNTRDLKILGNAIGESMVRPHQSQKFKQSMDGLSPVYRQQASQQSPMFQKSGSGRMFQQPQARRSQMFQQPPAGRSQMYQQKQMAARSFHQKPAAMPMASGFPKKAMPMASRGLAMRSPMRMPKPSYSMPSAARGMPMASRGFGMAKPMPMASPAMFGMGPPAMSPFMAPPGAFGGGGGFAPSMMIAPPLPSMGAQNGPKAVSLKDYLTTAVKDKEAASAARANSTKSSPPASGRSVLNVAKSNSSGTQQPGSSNKPNVTSAPLTHSIGTAINSTDISKTAQVPSTLPVTPAGGAATGTHEQDGTLPKRHSARRHKHYPHEHGGVHVP